MTRLWVIDTETTGFSPNDDRVVEVGGVLIEDGVVVKTYESLVSPGRDVPPAASAVHHLTDKHLVGAPSLEEALAPILEEDYHYLVAHNAKFDRQFVPTLGDLWICTYKCAMRKYPDAPSHSNQVLRYWLGLEDPKSATHAHRALYDAEVTANLLMHMVSEATTEDVYARMLDISSKPTLLKKVSFGKHKGKAWGDCPRDYLEWIVKKPETWTEDQVYTAKYWLERRT